MEQAIERLEGRGWTLTERNERKATLRKDGMDITLLSAGGRVLAGLEVDGHLVAHGTAEPLAVAGVLGWALEEALA